MQNTNQTKAAVAIFLKVNFKTRKFTSDKKKKPHNGKIKLLRKHALNNKAS